MKLMLNVVVDDGTPLMEKVKAHAANRTGMNKAMAAAMLIPVQSCLRFMSGTNHNKFEARGSFWNLMLSGTYADADGTGGWVATPEPVALRYYGGTVYPKEKQALAIPNRLEAYGKSPLDFPDLQLIVFKKPDGKSIVALVRRQSQLIKMLRSGRVKQGPLIGFLDRATAEHEAVAADVYYWLVPFATIGGNSNVLPDDDTLLASAFHGLELHFRMPKGAQ